MLLQIVAGGKRLWSGSWGSGSIDVPGLSDYRIVAFRCADSDIFLLGFVSGAGKVKATGGQVSSTPNVFLYCLDASRAGDSLTMVSAYYANVLGSNTYPFTVSEV